LLAEIYMDRKYSVIVFDLGNVLIPFDYQIVLKQLNEIDSGLGVKFSEFFKNNYHIHQSFERWEITTDEFISTLLKVLDNKLGTEEFCKIYSSLFTTNDDVIALLPELKKNYKLELLSNTNYIHQKYGYGHYEFLNHFDKLFLSHEIGAIKPEEKFYKAVETYTQKPPDEHIFIDDVEDYVDGAKKMGWDGIQFTGYDNLVSEFKLRGILNNSF